MCKEKNGAPGEVRTADLLVRSRTGSKFKCLFWCRLRSPKRLLTRTMRPTWDLCPPLNRQAQRVPLALSGWGFLFLDCDNFGFICNSKLRPTSGFPCIEPEFKRTILSAPIQVQMGAVRQSLPPVFSPLTVPVHYKAATARR